LPRSQPRFSQRRECSLELVTGRNGVCTRETATRLIPGAPIADERQNRWYSSAWSTLFRLIKNDAPYGIL
jgi:hypothetical protein